MAKKNAIEMARDLYSQFQSGVGNAMQNFNQPRQVTRPLIQTPLANVQPINYGQVAQNVGNFYQQQVQPRLQQIQTQVPRFVQNVGQQMQRMPDLQSPKLFGVPLINPAYGGNEAIRSAGKTIERIGQRKFAQGGFGNAFEDVTNVASVLPIGRLAKVGKVLAPGLEREAMMALSYLKSYDRLNPSAQIEVLSRIANSAKKVIPDVVGTKEVKKLAGRNPTEWRNVMAKFIEDRLVQSKNPSFNMGFSVKPLQKFKPTLPQAGGVKSGISPTATKPLLKTKLQTTKPLSLPLNKSIPQIESGKYVATNVSQAKKIFRQTGIAPELNFQQKGRITPIKIQGKSEFYSGGVTPQTMAKVNKIKIRTQESAAKADYREWQSQLFKQTGARTTTQAVRDATGAIKSQTVSPVARGVEELRDISGFSGQTRDVFRNFKVVYGKRFEDVKRVVLDPFIRSKGQFVDDLENWAGKLSKEIEDNLGIKKGSAESAAVQEFGEGSLKQLDLINKFGKGKTSKIMQADKWFRGAYNQLLDEVNAVRARIYPNDPTKIIPKRADYYRHFREMQQGFSGLVNIFDTPANIASSLSGVSEYAKPKAKWLSFAQKRLGLGTDIDAVGGFLDYIKASSYAKNIDPQIGKFRALSDELATATAEGTNKGKLNNFIEFLQDFSNDLSGKTAPADRFIQKVIPGGRKAFRVINWMNNRVKANVILGNLSSSIAQIFNVPQGMASVNNPAYWVKGMGKSLSSMFVKNKPMEQSIFLKERYFNAFDKFDRGLLNDTKKFAVWTIKVLDEVGSKYIWNMHYEKAIAERIPSAISYADDMTRNMVAGRGIGEVPLLQKSKVFQMVAPFQLEVGNLWHVMKDFVDERAFGKLATLFVTGYVFNKAAEQVRGSGVSFDPIEAVTDAFNTYQKEEDKGKGALLAGGRLAGEVLSNVPLGQTVAAGYNEYGYKVGDTQLPTRKALFGREDPTRFGSGLLVGKGLEDPLFKILPPFGGQQIKRTLEGVGTTLKGYSESKTGRVRFPVENTPVRNVQRAVFGQFSTPNAREYFNEERNVLGEKQSEVFKQSENKQQVYNKILQDRKESNIENQLKKDLESGKIPTNPSQDIETQKLIFKYSPDQVKVGDNYVLYKENDSIKTIDFTTPITPPKLTGYEDIDKVLTSKYSSRLTTEINNLIKLAELEQITYQQASELIKPIKAEQEQIKIRTAKTKQPKAIKPKKIIARRISARKTAVPKPIKLKIKTTKVKLKKYKPLPRVNFKKGVK